MNPSDPIRFARQTLLPEVGDAGQEKLARAHVAIIGIGGLGCPAAAYLTSAGVGRISLIDRDCVSLSNLPRQNLFTAAEIGRPKVTVAAEALRRLRDTCRIDPIDRQLSVSNAAALFEETDLVLDCTDNFGTKYLINDVCVSRSIPFVFAGVDRFTAQLALFQYRGGPTLRCVFPEPTAAENARQCSTDGILATATGVIGTMQAHLALLCLLEHPEATVASIRLINLLSLESRRISVCRSPGATRDGVVRDSRYYDSLDQRCERSRFVTAEQLRELFQGPNTPLVVDLSNSGLLRESPTVQTSSPAEFDDVLSRVPREVPLLIFCESGVKSAAAIQRLDEQGECRSVWGLSEELASLAIDLASDRAQRRNCSESKQFC
jgi:sulfur-carrier protein adenylyltransferase/sulfurtransferase